MTTLITLEGAQAAVDNLPRSAAREALRWEQIAASRNGARFTPQGDSQYDAIIAGLSEAEILYAGNAHAILRAARVLAALDASKARQ